MLRETVRARTGGIDATEEGVTRPDDSKRAGGGVGHTARKDKFRASRQFVLDDAAGSHADGAAESDVLGAVELGVSVADRHGISQTDAGQRRADPQYAALEREGSGAQRRRGLIEDQDTIGEGSAAGVGIGRA